MFFYLLVLLFLVSCSNDLGGNAQIDWNTANIRITTPAQLRELRDSVNAGNSFENRTITLANSLDLGNNETNQWTPIGTEYHPFRGTFNGNGNFIRGLFINSNTRHQGLFGVVGNAGVVKNLGVIVEILGNGRYVGGLAGANHGVIEKSYATGTISGDNTVGGLVGTNHADGIIENSYALASISGNARPANFGGLAGNNSGILVNSYFSGNVSGWQNVGLLVGANSDRGIIGNSYASGSVNGTVSVGGLVGISSEEATVCSNSAERTPAQMMWQGTFSGWNFTDIWGIEASRNDGLPFLWVFRW